MSTRQRRIAALLASTVSLATAAALFTPTAAMADTAPVAGDPTTVSNDALPAPQVNGVVWSQAISGDTVYAAGNFTTARPAGSPAGTNEVARTYILAYNINTGELISSFAPTVNGQILSVSATPDGSRVYIAGEFTNVNGSNKYRVAALNPTTGAVITSFSPGLNAKAKAVVATNDTVYVGGVFTVVNTSNRTRLAAFSASNGAVLDWAPTAAGGGNAVNALALSKDGSKVIVGGSFSQLNGATDYGLGAVSASTGNSVAYPAGDTIKNAGTNAGITSLNQVDGKLLGTGYVFGDGTGGIPKGNLEGIFQADSNSGSVDWVADYHGDHYSVWAMNDVAYGVGHAHQGANLPNGFPQTDPWTFHHADAVTQDARGTNGYQNDGYPSWLGTAAPKMLNWYPDLTAGTFTGQSQAAWSITGNDKYLVLGGEFPKVNGVAQQGLVRFARTDIAPNKSGPVLSGAQYTPTLTSPATGLVRGSIAADYDYDNENLTYEFYRSGKADPVYTTTVNSTFFRRPTVSFVDADAPAGETAKYRVKVTDPKGNTVWGDSVTVPVSASGSVSPYALQVYSDGAQNYWRLDEASGNVVNDWAGNNNATAGSGVTRGADGAILGDVDKASNFAGNANGIAVSNTKTTGAQVFSVSAWFKTTTTSGGKIVGFGAANTGSSSNYDRHIYMQNNGKVAFGVYNGATQTITSSQALNDGKWHQVTGTLDSNGQSFYVDGQLVGTNTGVTTAENYSGYWRIGGDNLNGWPSAPSSYYFNGAIDDVSVYSTALSGGQVSNQWNRSGWGTNSAPTASFTQTTTGRKVDVDGTTSTDADGQVVSYAWDFGDGTTATGATASHTYATDGTFTVKLTVTDNLGAQASTQTDVQPQAPNVLPVADFTHSENDLSATFDASSSHDPDGTIASYDWDFGDGSTGSGVNVQHDYATAGAKQVTLTVTDNRGGTKSVTKTVNVVAPNVPPQAAFVANTNDLTTTVDASGSSDSDGTIASYDWDFGDGQTGSGKTANHTYATPGPYTIKLTVTDNRGGTATTTADVTATAPAFLAKDDFARTLSGSWGTSLTGGAWSLSGTATNFSVANGWGAMSVPAVSTQRTASLNSLKQTNGETTVDMALNRPVGGSTYVWVSGRRVNASNEYRAKLRYFENGDVNVALTKVVAGTETTLTNVKVPNLTFNNGDVVRVRMQVVGNGTSALRVKVWKATDTEPANWTTTTTDSTAALQADGGVAISSYTSGTVTNLPYVVLFDNLSVVAVNN